MKRLLLFFTSFVLILVLNSCNELVKTTHKKTIVWRQPKKVSYTLINSKVWLKENSRDSVKIDLVTAINRTDRTTLASMDSILIPNDFSGDVVYYLPFPLNVPYLKNVAKILFFSYPTQTFAAYENGILTYSGPTNMGRKKDQTPTGLFFTNWKAEKTTSTFNDEWDLKWNFNIENKLGIGFHQYQLPGYPASHSCLRLSEKDAKFLYQWADQWVLANAETIKVTGTPVIVFGSYNFDAPKPWLNLIKKPKALDISEATIKEETSPFLESILTAQKTRVNYLQNVPNN